MLSLKNAFQQGQQSQFSLNFGTVDSFFLQILLCISICPVPLVVVRMLLFAFCQAYRTMIAQ